MPARDALLLDGALGTGRRFTQALGNNLPRARGFLAAGLAQPFRDHLLTG